MGGRFNQEGSDKTGNCNREQIQAAAISLCQSLVVNPESFTQALKSKLSFDMFAVVLMDQTSESERLRVMLDTVSEKVG